MAEQHEHEWDYEGNDLGATVDNWYAPDRKILEVTVSMAVSCKVDACEATSRINVYGKNPELDEIEEPYKDE